MVERRTRWFLGLWLAGWSLFGLYSIEAWAAPSVRMYGASWCGPCRTVKKYLRKKGVSFQYLDIDVPKNRALYLQDRSRGGIPLLIIGRDKIVGANLLRIRAALERARVLKENPKKTPPKGGSYGGHSAEWWQRQFRDLRGRLHEMRGKVKRFEQVAVDHHEKEVLQKMRANQKILEESVDQLEVDASRVSLPRKYRQ